MNIPNFPECQLPAPSVSDEPEVKNGGNKANPLQSRSSRLEDEYPCTPGQTSTTSVTSTMPTKTSFRLWIPTEEAEEEPSPQTGTSEVDDTVPINRSNSFRNLSTLIAWEKNEEIHTQEDETLTRQAPQPSIDFTKCDNDDTCPGSPFWMPRFNNQDPFNKEPSLPDPIKTPVTTSDLDDDDYVVVETAGKQEKIPLRTRIMWKFRNMRSKKKQNFPRERSQSG